MRKTVLSFLGAVLLSMPVLAQTSVKLNTTASPSSGEPGLTSVSVTGSGFPSGTITPANVTVTLAPSGGTGVTTTATSVATGSGTTRTVSFVIPGSISVTTPTTYAVTIAGHTDANAQFQSSNSASLTINPPPYIRSVSPVSGLQGQTLSVTITGQYTSFVKGVTQANFGPGVAVGGAAEGANGPVTVNSATSAVASIVIDNAATLGNRDVTVTTGSQTNTLASGFAIKSYSVKLVSPSTPSTGQAGVTTVSVTGSGFPSGNITPSNVTVTLTHSGSTPITTTAGSVVAGSGSTETVSFLIPSSISVTSPTAYAITISGQTDAGIQFQSSSATLTINPPAAIHSISPVTGLQGQTLSVTISGSYTAFASGVTQANFGPGISVGGAAEGANGPVTVNSATSAVASLVIDATAAVGSRDVTVVTGTQTVTLSSGFAVHSYTISLGSSTSPTSGQPGVTTVSVTGSGFPSGNITPSNVTVTLTPSGGSAVTTTATSVVTGSGTSRTVGFLIPASISVSVPTVYAVSISGHNDAGSLFQSSNSSSLTINELPSITSVSPNVGAQGQTFSVTIAGSFTSWVNGTTQANFGSGIAVGGKTAGSNGPVTVTSPTTAVASIVISSAATLGVRTVKVITGTQTLSLTNGFTVQSANRPPVAVPGGPYSVTRPAAVQLNGTGSYDPDTGDTITYDWKFGDGTADGTVATPSHTYAAAGTYNGSLTVTDNHGLSSAPVGFVVTVSPATPMAVPGGPYSATRPAAVQLNGSSSYDPDPTVTITYDWKFGDGTADGTGATTSHTYATAGMYNGSLTVTDNHGVASAPVAFVVTVIAATPIAVPGGPYSVTLPTAVQFNGSGSNDPDPNVTLSYDWKFGDGTPDGTGATTSHAYTAPGTYNGSLTVTDNHGVASAPVAFVVNVIAATPIAVPGGPYNEKLPAVLQLDGSGSYDPDPNSTITYDWNFGDGSTDGTGSSPTHTYAAAGTFNGSLTVTDNHGVSSAAVGFVVTVTQPNPVAVPGGPYSVQLPAAVQFDGSGSSDPTQGATLTFDWNYGDGTPDGSGPKPSHTYATSGTYNGTLTVTDNFGYSSGPVAFTANIAPSAPPPQVVITSPQALTVFNAAGNPITVTGTIDNSNDAVSVNGTAATVSGGTFTASGILLREGPNVITVTGTDSVGNVGTASETVTLNTTPPQLGILAPTDGAVLASSTVTVAGNVNEQVPGTINAKQVVVMVNGIAAAVSNRTFSATNVPLVQGMNTITVVATDPAGNTSQSQIHVTYMGAIPVQKILKVSGESQTAPINTTLPQPLVVQVVDSNGAPVPNQAVKFTVVKSDGALTSTNQQGQQVNAVTDQNGQASVQFMLGSRVGVGNNQVSVTAPGYVGQALFCETSTVGPPTKILVEMGDAQTGLAGQALPSPLVVEVFDAGGNPASYVPVTFNVEQGGGNFNGNPTLQVSTDINGMASALLTLGQQEGTNNNVVSATFGGNAGPAASFVASGQAGGPASITSISGLVEDDSNTPVPGATIVLEGTPYTATSDMNGNFSISPAPVGTFLLQVNGHTSTRTDATFPTLVYNITTIAGLNNTLGMPICLPPLDPTSVQTYDPNSNQTLTLQMTGVPGYTFTVYPHSAFNPDGTPYSGPLSLSQVHADRVPMAPPHGSLPLIAGTLQPPGLHFNPPVTTQFPNTSALAPGTVLDVYSYDHDQMEWVSQGPARVSADGSVIQSDPGFGISKSGWHFPPPPPPPPKCPSSCKNLNPCVSGKCVNGSCAYTPVGDGSACGDGTATEQCGTGGKCKGGSCNYDTTATDGTPCTPENKCVMDAKCVGGKCLGKPYDTSSWTDDKSLVGSLKFPEELTSTISSWLSTITNGNIQLEGLEISGDGKKKNCCNENTGPIDGGEVEASGSGKLVAHIKGFPLGGAFPSIFKIVTIPIINKQVQLEFALGAYFGADLSFGGHVGIRQNQCETDKSCGFGDVSLGVEPDVYIQGKVMACTSIYTPADECVGGNVTGGLKVTLSGGGRFKEPECDSPPNIAVSGSKPTVHGEADVAYLGFKAKVGFEWTLDWWPAWSCSYPGGCHAEK